MPGAKGYGTIWFKWVQPAGLTTAGISTCTSNSPALDSIVQVFAASDHTSPQAECNSLIPLACNDDFTNCGSSQRKSRLCLRDLTPGATYYIMLAAKTPNHLGQYLVTISTSCSATTPSCPYCPTGMMNFIDPPDGVVDARRPHPPGHPQTPEGIQTIVVHGPAGATRNCWSVCESPSVEAAIEIAFIEEGPYGTYTIQFDRPITPGSVTFLTYQDDQSWTSVGRFIAHPGNVNGDSAAFATDILDLVDYLNGIIEVPWGPYSADLDRSGIVAPADLITLIDLLNGVTAYHPWWNTELPQATECP
jgi:hypothetical protein